MMKTVPSTTETVVSDTSTLLVSSVMLLATQARFTSRLTPDLYEEQHRKTAESQRELCNLLGINPKQCTHLIGYVNMAAIGGLIWRKTRRQTAMALASWLALGVLGRYRTGRSVGSPLAVIVLLLGVFDVRRLRTALLFRWTVLREVFMVGTKLRLDSIGFVF